MVECKVRMDSHATRTLVPAGTHALREVNSGGRQESVVHVNEQPSIPH